MDIKKYVVSGKTYDTLEEVPQEWRSLFDNSKEIFNVKANDTNVSVIAPVNDTSPQNGIHISIAKVKTVLYIVTLFITWIENGVFYTIARTAGIKEQNLLGSFVVSAFIAAICQKLARRKLKSVGFANITFAKELSFMNNFILTMVASGYAVLFNVIYFYVLYLLK